MLFFLLLGIMMPGVDGLVREPIFMHLDVADDVTMVCTTPTSSRGTGGGQGKPLAAVTHQGDGRRVPLIGPAKGGFVDLVVRFDVLDDPRHSLAPSNRLSAARAGS